jgi:L-glyceraldehyde 3-phosphate reductase
MEYRRCGNSGILLPAISLGLWHNFGGVDLFEKGRSIIHAAFDRGITHFDLANNYGPPPGSAEEHFGQILAKDFTSNLRDELIISTKAGYTMWPGPYGDWGSRKYLISSLDQSLKRMGLDYVDIFYSHRPDPETPLEETMMALDQIVRSGKALYAGISNYNANETAKAIEILKELGTPCLIHQAKYSLFDRWVENGLLSVLKENGVGCIAFSPLAEGLLTNKYLNNVPADSRMAKEHGHLQYSALTPETQSAIRALNEMAISRGQSLSQMALSWLLHDNRLTSVIIGVSSVEQLLQNLETLNHLKFHEHEHEAVKSILKAMEAS